MLKTALIAVTVLAVAAPALAKSAKKAETAPAGWENAAPIPYSDLAAFFLAARCLAGAAPLILASAATRSL